MSDYEDNVKNIMAQIRETNVEAIFGASRQVDNKIIITVGKISYGWGGGSGKGKAPEKAEEGEGGGIGMGVKVKPIGYIIAGAEEVTYQPIIDFGKILTILAPLLAWIVYRAVRRNSE